jgi:hypothetical protein
MKKSEKNNNYPEIADNGKGPSFEQKLLLIFYGTLFSKKYTFLKAL